MGGSNGSGGEEGKGGKGGKYVDGNDIVACMNVGPEVR